MGQSPHAGRHTRSRVGRAGSGRRGPKSDTAHAVGHERRSSSVGARGGEGRERERGRGKGKAPWGAKRTPQLATVAAS